MMAAENFLPAPWAWYRGDSLTGTDGQIITAGSVLWDDRVAGPAGDADIISDTEYAADAAEGHPGFLGDPSFGFHSFEPSLLFDNGSALTAGFAVAFIGRFVAGGFLEVYVSEPAVGPTERLYGRVGDGEQVASRYTNGWNTLVATATASESMSGTTLAVVAFSPSGMDVWLNGVKVVENLVDPGLFNAHRIELSISSETAARQSAAEYILYNRALTLADHAGIYDYYRCWYFGEGCLASTIIGHPETDRVRWTRPRDGAQP